MRIVRLAQDESRPSSERLGECVRLFFLTSAAFSVAALFFPYTGEAFRCVLSLIVVGLIVGSIATLQGYPPIFFSFALPNGLAVSLGWLLSAPGNLPYWVHVAMALMMLILLMYLLELSRETYHSFAVSKNTNAMLQLELEKAQRINNAKSKVFASASHDLRQPLQSISLLSHKLSNINIIDSERKSVVATIDSCVELLSEELDMLLDISNLESDIPANNPEQVDLCELVENLADLYTPIAIAKGVELKVVVPHPASVRADRVLLTRLLRNLIDNSLKYTSEGDVSIKVHRDGTDVIVDIADTGHGISTQDQSLIFDEFYQSGNPERDRSKGLGLGLSVVNRILPLVGGKLSVESMLSVGSLFRLQLPASDEGSIGSVRLGAETSKTLEPSGELNFLSDTRVLLVEDHELVQKATRSLLEANGAEVILAVDWAGVEKLLDAAMPDLLISDLRLPKDSGLEIANRLRSINHRLPVVLVSGDMSSDLAANAQEAGYRVLGKPVSVPSLLDEIRSVLV